MCKCIICGKEDYKIDTKKFPKKFCSYHCYEEWLKYNKEPNCECAICGKKMYKPQNRLKKIKTGVTCSKECLAKLNSITFSGENNHQFGLIGNKNASFKGEIVISNYGYILEYCPGHPYPHDRSNNTTRVFQHRLIIERNTELFNAEFFEVVDGWKVLKQCYKVHHINENKQDNRIENLQILTISEHSKLHCLDKELVRDELGRIIGVVKLGNIGEVVAGEADDNTEISLN